MLQRIKLGPKLIGSFLLVISVAVAIGLLSLQSMERMAGAKDKIIKVRLASIVALGVINEGQTAVQSIENALTDPATFRNDEIRKTAMARWEAKWKDIDKAWDVYAPLEQTTDEAQVWEEFKPQWAEWRKRDEAFVKALREKESMLKSGLTDEDPKMRAMEKKLDGAAFYASEAFGPAEKSLTKIVDINNKNATDDSNTFEAVKSSSRRTMLIFMAIGVSFSVGLSVYFTFNLNSIIKGLLNEAKKLTDAAVNGRLGERADVEKTNFEFRGIVQGVNETLDALIKPLNVSAEYMDKISKGIIPPAITDEYKGDFNDIKNSINVCIGSLSGMLEETGGLIQAVKDKKLDKRGNVSKFQGGYAELVGGVNTIMDTMNDALMQVVDAVNQVTSASEQINAGSQAVAEGAAEQASSLEEITSSLEEMASMTKQNAANAGQAQILAKDAFASTDRGNKEMDRMNNAIEDIKKSADQTAKIIKTIDEIAFQTNLLALNAAVEAARAGEAGKGFAVVAEEVRNLAQRSAEAAKNTAAMIEDSVKNADNGVKITTDVAAILKEIGAGTEKVNNLVREIALASKEQSQGIEQVNMAMGQLDKVTQSNSSSAEESASAAEELSSQAILLSEMVGAFTLAGYSGGSTERTATQGNSALHRHAPRPALKKTGNNSNGGNTTALLGGVRSRLGQPDVKMPSAMIPLENDENFSEF